MNKKSAVAVAVAVAGMFIAGKVMADTKPAAGAAAPAPMPAKVMCKGGNACKGKGECKAKGSCGGKDGCKGKNSCKGKGSNMMSADDCTKAGGTVVK